MQREAGKDGEPADHSTSLTLSGVERDGRLGGNVQDHDAFQERLSKAVGGP